MQSSFLRRRVGVRAAFEVLRGMTFYETPLESPRFDKINFCIGIIIFNFTLLNSPSNNYLGCNL